jgi:hypothetical protein
MADGKITATLKAGTGFDAPWVVVSADTSGELRDRLGEIEQSGALVDVSRVAKAFQGYAAVGGTLGARPVDAPGSAQQQPPAQAPQGPPQGAQQQPPAGSWGNAPQQPQQPPQQPAAPQGGSGQPFILKDNFGNEWEYDVPGAPMTPRGPAIVKRGVNAKNGSVWRKWYDPAAGPKWFTDRQAKVATADRWQGEFIN